MVLETGEHPGALKDMVTSPGGTTIDGIHELEEGGVRGALMNSGFKFPSGHITVNLAPADLPKEGGRFDLPIAIGILAASAQAPSATLADHEFIAELALTGAMIRYAAPWPRKRQDLLQHDNETGNRFTAGTRPRLLPVVATARTL